MTDFEVALVESLREVTSELAAYVNGDDVDRGAAVIALANAMTLLNSPRYLVEFK